MDTRNPLLDLVPSETAQQYYKALLPAAARVEVRLDAGGARGKGLFATQGIKQGDVIFQERPLVGTQELHSKLDTSTCANCFTAVGTVEQAFGGKMCAQINELSELSDPTGAQDLQSLKEIQRKVDKIQAAVDARRLEGLLSGQLKLPLTDKVELCTQPVRCRGGCDDEYCSSDCEARAWQHHHCLLCPGPQEEQASSSSSSKRGGAGSSKGAAARKVAAETVHGARVNRAKLAKFLAHADDTNGIFRVAAQVVANTLITADTILQQAAADASEASEAAAAYNSALSAAAAAGQRSSLQVLAAAGPAAATASSAQVAAAVPDAAVEQQVAAAAFAAASAAAAQPGSSSSQVLAPATAEDAATGTAPQEQQSQPQPSKQQCLAALKSAFLPYAMGHKAPWWQVVQAAEEAAAAAKAAAGSDRGSDDDDDSSEEDVDPAELAAQLRELSAESLALLRAGLQDDRFPELFDLQLYGCLVGMFELNNLALTVPAPVGRYKALLADPQAFSVSAAEAQAALDEVQPLLDALGYTADETAEGTGFYALQSTINHSCAPNAAAECVPSGQVVVTALQDVPAGFEVLLSYIEEEGADVRERQLMLRDYGFECACQRCEAEQLADGLAKQQL